MKKQPRSPSTVKATDWPPHLIKAAKRYHALGEKLVTIAKEAGASEADIDNLYKCLLLGIPRHWPMPPSTSKLRKRLNAFTNKKG
jgi:hypothetical protein